MPSEEEPPPPSAVTTAWNWVIEELADCKEFDSSIFSALMRWDRSIFADPVYGARTMERLALRYLEELVDSAEFLPPLPSPKAAAAAPVPGSEVLVHGMDAGASSESILRHYSQEVGGSNSTGNCIDESCRNALRQVILQNRAAFHKSSLDRLKDLILEDCCQGASFSNNLSCLVTGDQRNSLHTDNADDREIVSKKFKLDNSQIQKVKLLSAISSGTNQDLLLKEDTSRHENQLSKDNVQNSLDNNAYSMERNVASRFPVGKNKMPQSSSPLNTRNNIQSTYVSSDRGRNVLLDSPSDGEGYCDAAPNFHPDDEILAAEALKFLSSQNPACNDSQIGEQQRSCIKCDKGGQLLTCTGSECPIAVHESCLGLSADAENLEEFKCPVCSYLLAVSAFNEAREKVSVAGKNLSLFMDWGRMGLKKVPLSTLTRESIHARKPLNGNHPDNLCVKARTEIIKEPSRRNQEKSSIDGNNGNLPAGEGHTLIDRNNDSASPSGETETVNEFRVVSKSQHQGQTVTAAISDGHGQHKVPICKGKSRSDNHCHYTRMARQYLSGECKSAFGNRLCHADSGTSKIMETDKGSPSPETGDSELSDRPSSLEYAQGLKHQQQVSSDSDTISLPCQEIHVECEKLGKQDSAIEHGAEKQNSSKIHTVHSSPNKGRKQKNSSRHTKRYANPMFPYSRRNRLPWTSEEEAILKEAMQKFYPSGEASISWIKIWEFGRNIFHKTRQPDDLKGKWRNIRMRKGESWKGKSSDKDDES